MFFSRDPHTTTPLVKLWIGHDEGDEKVIVVPVFLRAGEMLCALECSRYSAFSKTMQRL